MQSDTKAELITSGVSAIGAIAKEMFVRRQEQQVMEQKAQYDKKIAEARAGDTANQAPDNDGDGPVNALDQAADLADQYDELLARAEAEEDCELCRSLISSARELPLDRQRKAIPQLRDFLSQVEDDATRADMVQQIRESPELKALMKRHMNTVGEVTSSDGEGDEPAARQRESAPGSNAPTGGDHGTQSSLF